MIFPTMRGARFGHANVAEFAKTWLLQRRLPGNPLLDPVICQQMIADLHRMLDVDWTYGGWLEDRSTLWHGSYITERGTPLHLGVDFNVPTGTPVATNVHLRVLRVDNDHPEPHGWGTRVTALVIGEEASLIFAHLQNVQCRAGDELNPDDILAEVGAPDRNGGWYPHLHVQAMRVISDGDCLTRLHFIDGYGASQDRHALASRFPDPLNYVALR